MTHTQTHDVALRAADHDFRARVYPAAVPNGTVLVWLHGGAFVFGDLDMPEAHETAGQLAARGTSVVSVDYTLASADVIAALPPMPDVDGMPTREEFAATIAAAGPRAGYPVASLQVVAAFDWAVRNAPELGGDAHRVGIGGASAGGNLAASGALRLRDRGAAQPSGLALVYPVLHAELPPADDELVGMLSGLPTALTFPPESTRAINANYLAGASPDDPYAFPGGHDLRGLPATFIATAQIDRLRTSGAAFASELAQAGVDVEYVTERGALHGFLNMAGDAAAERTVDRVARFLREHAS